MWRRLWFHYWREMALGIGAALVVVLGLNGVDVTPFLLLGGVFAFMWYMMEGKAVNRRFEAVMAGSSMDGTLGVTFDDIGGQEVAKREFLEALEFVKNMDSAAKLGIRPLRGILLTGPPGTGKTLLAKAAANYTDAVFLAASGSQFVEMYAGVGAQRVRRLFQQARSLAQKQGKKHAVIFIDEIDVLGSKRGVHSSHLEYDQTLNELLVQMDGIRSRDDEIRILVVAATNRPDLLDPALLRPGRFDRIVRVDLPDRAGRLHILRIHTRNKPLACDVDLDAVARETYGFSGAHLESVVNEAAILAMRSNRDRIAAADFREAIDKVMMGERLSRTPRTEERERIAFHEAGHAIVSEITKPGSVSMVTITSRGNALGYMRQAPADEQYLYTRDELLNQIAVALGGAVAEELRFGARSTGSVGDFEHAVRLARQIIEAGMSSLGVVCMETIPSEKVHSEIQRIVGEQETVVRQWLEERRSVLESVARQLLENEKMEGDTLRALVAETGGHIMNKRGESLRAVSEAAASSE